MASIIPREILEQLGKFCNDINGRTSRAGGCGAEGKREASFGATSPDLGV